MLKSPQALQREEKVDADEARLQERTQAERPGLRPNGSRLHSRHRTFGVSREEEESSTGGAAQPAIGEDALPIGGDVRVEQTPAAEVGRQGFEDEESDSQREYLH